VQAEAILNLRLKSLSRLEEIEIKAEHDKLSKERRERSGSLLEIGRAAVGGASPTEVRRRGRPTQESGARRRRSSFATAPDIEGRPRAGDDEKGPSPSSSPRRAGSAP
jgi:topoisomerase-4 subunit A